MFEWRQEVLLAEAANVKVSKVIRALDFDGDAHALAATSPMRENKMRRRAIADASKADSVAEFVANCDPFVLAYVASSAAMQRELARSNWERWVRGAWSAALLRG